MASNPIKITIPANSQGGITCISNAAYFQRVTLSWAETIVIFQGAGEGQPMKTPDGRDSYLLGPASKAYQIVVTFEYSSAGPNGPFEAASVRDPITTTDGVFTVIEMASEDSTDQDNNDSCLTFVLASKQLQDRQSIPKADWILHDPIITTGGTLELHAKTYYDNPQVAGGDEHIISVPDDFIEKTTNIDDRCTGWSLFSGTAYHKKGTFVGGTIYIDLELNNCSHPEMRDALLWLFAVIPYWTSRPKGYVSVDWEGIMDHSKYKLTRVTH